MTTSDSEGPAKSDEELAQIAFLDELRKSDYESQPERPVAVVVEVPSVRDVPKANEQYALAEISDGSASWTVCLPRGIVTANGRALFLSEEAVLPTDNRYVFGTPPLVRICKRKGGITDLTLNVRRNIYRANQGVLYPVSLFPEIEESAVGEKVAEVLHIRSRAQVRAEAERRMEEERARAKAEKAEKAAKRRLEAERRDAEEHAQALKDKAARKALAQKRNRVELMDAWRAGCEAVGPAPDFVRKTSLESVEEAPELFEQYTDCLFEVTEKVRGLNLSVYCVRDGRAHKPIGVCVDGQEIAYRPKAFPWDVIRSLGVDNALLTCCHDLVVEGVLVCTGGRSGCFGERRSADFFVFNIYDLTEERVLQAVERKVFCKRFRLRHVPIIAYHKCVFAEFRTLDALEAYAAGRGMDGGPRQGVVLRSEDPSLDVWVQVKGG